MEAEKWVLNDAQKKFLWDYIEMWGVWEEWQNEYNYEYWANKEWVMERNSEPIKDFPYSLRIDDFEYDRLTNSTHWKVLNCIKENVMSVREITMQVFDTLMHNTKYPQFNANNVADNCYCDTDGTIYVEYCGKKFMWQIVEV